MKFDAGKRTRIYVDLIVGIDPDGSTVELRVDGTWYAATWLATATTTTIEGRTAWLQTALTTGYFAGPDATASGATVVTLGNHPMEARVTSGQDILTVNLDPMTVK